MSKKAHKNPAVKDFSIVGKVKYTNISRSMELFQSFEEGLINKGILHDG